MKISLSLIIVVSITTALIRPCKAQTQTIDSLKKIAALNSENVVGAIALNKLSTEYTRYNLNQAKLPLYRSIILGKKFHRPDILAYAYAHMASIQSEIGNTDSTNHYINYLKLLSQTVKGQYANNVKGYYYFSAGLLLKQQGKFRAAIPLMDNGLKYFTADGEPAAIAAQCMSIGNNYIMLADYSNALRYHLAALKLFIKISNQRGESFCYQNIASDFSSMNMHQEALPYAKKAMELKKHLKDKRGVVGASTGLGTVYEGLKAYNKAIYYYKQALQILKNPNLPQEQGELQILIGEHYVHTNELALARSAFEQSKKLALQTKNHSLLQNAEAKIASVSRSGSFDDESRLLTSLHSAIQNGNKSAEMDIYSYLSSYYQRKKNYKKALDYKSLYLTANDSLRDNSLLVQLKSMEEQFQREKTIKEIAILKKDKEINKVNLEKQKNIKFFAIVIATLLLIILYVWIKNQKARNMIQMQKLRDGLSRDLHDDIGSRLTNIQFLAHLSSQENININQKAEHLTNIKQEIFASNQALDEIVWNMKTSSEELDHISVRIRRYAGNIFEDETVKIKITIADDFPDTRIFHETQRDLFLMFKEILNNIRKHAKATEVSIKLESDRRNLWLKVTDNGIGFDLKAVNPKRNGLINLKKRAEKWHGKFDISPTLPHGTSATISIPHEQVAVKALITNLKTINKQLFKKRLKTG